MTHRRGWIEAERSAVADAPQFLVLEANHEFFNRAHKLRALCLEHKLEEIEVFWDKAQWHPTTARPGPLRLVVTRSHFWFKAHHRYSDEPFATPPMHLDAFERRFLGKEVTDEVFGGFDHEEWVKLMDAFDAQQRESA